MRIMKLALTAVFAVLAFSAMAAGSASAAHPSFLTASGSETLFSGVNPAGTTPTLRALNLSVLGTITCEKVLVDGWALPKSPLAHRILVHFHGDCLQTIGSTKNTCAEPIVAKLALGELGLVLGNQTVGILLVPSDGTKIFAEPSCGGSTTIVLGAVVGEIPSVNKKGVAQYNKELTESEQVFEAEGKSSEKQNITEITLLGVTMTKADLDVEGFFGGLASEEATVILKSATGIEICTVAEASCP